MIKWHSSIARPLVNCKLNSVLLFPVVRKMSKIPSFKPTWLHWFPVKSHGLLL